MRALPRKLFRDLWRARGQAAAIALVIGAGVAMFVLVRSAFDSLERTRAAYYEQNRFADVFASARRAPLRLVPELRDIPGVTAVDARVVADVTIDVPGLAEPAVGRLISIPVPDRPTLNDVVIVSGRYPSAGRPDEVLVSEPFAAAHDLGFGDRVGAVINGRLRHLVIVGVALSPEYVYPIRPGALLPDEARFGVFWMAREPLAAAFEMEGGFDDVSLRVAAGASAETVIDRVDRLLAPFGGTGAIPRRLQTSHFYLENELSGLRGIGAIVPVVFLVVAAFLLQMVLSRIVALEREQIATLKAVGYSNGRIALHWVGWGLVVAVVGAAVGTVAGAWLGSGLTRLYARFFHFPILEYRLLPSTVVLAWVASLVGATLGTLGAVRRAVRLAPAEAMRPEPPARYRPSLVERLGPGRLLSQPARMVLRNLERKPWRAGASAVAMAFGGAMLIVGSFTYDAIDVIAHVLFDVAQRYDVMVTFVDPASADAIHEIRRLPGVRQAEPFRSVAVRLRHGPRARRSAILGLVPGPRLNRLVDADERVVDLPPAGLVLSAKLADLLGVGPGDDVTVEVLEGARPVREVRVARVFRDFLGVSAYMAEPAVHRLMREGDVLSGAYLSVDRAELGALYRRLKHTPRIAGVTLEEAAVESFRKTLAENFAIIGSFNVLFAAIIAFGVVYNTARIALSERDRELATLRVIGFTRAEIARILLGELALITAVAIPLGLALGYGLAALTVRAYDTEMFRIPLVVDASTYGLSAATVAGAAIVSGAVVRRKLARLDLIGVLKTRE